MKSLASFKGTCDIRVWLCQIEKNSYLSYLRKHERIADAESAEDKPDSFDMLRSVCQTEAAEKGYKIIHDLSEPYKEVFMLTLITAIIIIANLLVPAYFPYSDDLITVRETSDGTVYASFSNKVSGYGISTSASDDNSGIVCHIATWDSIWDRQIVKKAY